MASLVLLLSQLVRPQNTNLAFVSTLASSSFTTSCAAAMSSTSNQKTLPKESNKYDSSGIEDQVQEPSGELFFLSLTVRNEEFVA
ncbi:hypothetical protein OIU77_018989 [Salix suchowensis]|uniref:Uncharacterized protein n=1 Tax=Salix suchowensis TaxID=1278906 RepID=A0ABQ9CFF8_9ROSI|nr:hypothetical protein OIU77_018989 [Salix suchowensis]